MGPHMAVVCIVVIFVSVLIAMRPLSNFPYCY